MSSPTYPVGTIAKLLLVSERRVQQLTAKGIIPRAAHGRYELAPAVQGYIRFLQTGRGDEEVVVDFHAEKALLTKAQREQAELELSKARGEVAPLEDVERLWSRAFAELRTNILNVPGRVSRQLIGETNEARFKEVLRAELAGALEATADAELPDDDEDDADPAEDE